MVELRNANPLAAYMGGMDMGQRQEAVNFLRQYGAAAAGGDKAALNALMSNPYTMDRALDMQSRADDMAYRNEMLGMRRDEHNAQLEQWSRQASAAEKAQAAADLESAVKIMSGVQDPETWDRLAVQYGQENLVGQFDNRNAVMRQFMSFADIIRMDAGPAPLSGPGKVQADINAGYLPKDTPLIGDDQRTRKISDAMRLYGLSEPDATALVDGHVGVDRDPLTRDVTTYDKRSIFNAPQQPAQVADNRAPSEEPLKFNIPGANDSFGLEGFGKRALNTGADIVGAQVPFPEVQDAQSDFATFREDVLSSIAAGYDRQPPSWLLQALRDLTPEAGNPFQGAQGAQSKLRALVRKFDRELQVQERQLQRRQSPQDRAESERRVAALEATRDYVSATLRAFDSGGGDMPPAFANEVGDLEGGITAQDVWDSMTDEQRRLWAK